MVLNKAERELIIEMCSIADAGGLDEDGNGEGDYQAWTPKTFELMDGIRRKMIAESRKKVSTR